MTPNQALTLTLSGTLAVLAGIYLLLGTAGLAWALIVVGVLLVAAVVLLFDPQSLTDRDGAAAEMQARAARIRAGRP